MESDRQRNPDSVEQAEEREMKNPITDEDATLGESGDALIPRGEEPERDKDELEGPAPRTSQMPR